MLKKKRVLPVSNNQAESRKVLSLSKENISHITASFIKEIIHTRHSKGLSQKNLQDISGVRQPVIARLETGETDPQLSTIIKVLHPLGMTISVVPLYTKHNGLP